MALSPVQERLLRALTYCTTQMNYNELLVARFLNYTTTILASKLQNRMKAFEELFFNQTFLCNQSSTLETPLKISETWILQTNKMNPRAQKIPAPVTQTLE